MTPPFHKQPLEFYGQSTLADLQPIRAAIAAEHCPFLQRRCLKQRKSDMNQTIGSCTVGYQNHPLIICPFRFLSDNLIFRDSVPLLLSNLDYVIIPEIAMPGGNVDYFLVGMQDNSIVDYLGIEIQSLDTTASGAIWQA